MKQIHSATILEIPKIITQKVTTIPNCDGLITSSRSHVLAVKFADCMPIVIYHPAQILCVLHAGRKGTQEFILKKALQKIKRITHSTKNYIIWFGPHICTYCHQINKETDHHYSLLQENITQLQSELDLKSNYLHCVTECTKRNTNFFSYRRSHTAHRNVLFASL